MPLLPPQNAEPTDRIEAVDILEIAREAISGPRAEDYGSYIDQMKAIAEAFNAIKHSQTGPLARVKLTPEDISLILILLKVRRRCTSTDADSNVDLAGYAALDWELRQELMEQDAKLQFPPGVKTGRRKQGFQADELEQMTTAREE